MHKQILWIILLFSSRITWAIDGPKILEIGSSKNSIMLDRGKFEGLHIGLRAKIYYLDKSKGFLRPKMVYLAEGEAIKVHSNYSYWFLRKVKNKNKKYLQKGRKVYLIAHDKVGRRPYKIRKTKHISPSKQNIEEFIEDRKANIPRKMIKESEKYGHTEAIVDVPTKLSADNHVQTFTSPYIQKEAEWDEDYLAEYERVHFTPVSDSDINFRRRALERDVFNSTSFGVERKINSQKYGLVGLYQDSERDSDNITIKRRYSEDSTYYKARENREKSRLISNYALDKINNGGPLWSANMDDEQLRRFFINSGIESEIRRRRDVLEERPGHELAIKYSSGFESHTTASDSNHQNVDYSLGLSYEIHFSRFLKILSNMTMELELERGISHYDIGGVNGRFVEGSFRGYMHWFFLNSPHSISKFMPYVGLGIRRGTATMESFSVSSDYEYQILAFPSYRAGIKYRFKAGDTRDEILKIGFGLNFGLTFESARYSIVNQVVSNVEPVINPSLVRFVVGLNVYF